MNLSYGTVQDLAADMKKYYFSGFHSLPYNRFNVETSQHYWLSPTSEKAAFPYSKAAFTKNDEWVEAGHVFCGFNVEKGVLHEADWPRSNVMDDSWFWHRFLDLANSPLASLAEKASAAIDGNLQIFITAGIMATGHDGANAMFEIDDSELKLVSHKTGDGILRDLSRSSNFAELADSLRALDGKPTEWYWIDFHLGTFFTLDPTGPNHLDRCAAMLKPFEPWILSSAKH